MGEKLTIGRILRYYPSAADTDLHRTDKDGKVIGLAAIVCYVWSETMANLTVCCPNGHTHARTSVAVAGADGVQPEGSNCYAAFPTRS